MRDGTVTWPNEINKVVCIADGIAHDAALPRHRKTLRRYQTNKMMVGVEDYLR